MSLGWAVLRSSERPPISRISSASRGPLGHVGLRQRGTTLVELLVVLLVVVILIGCMGWCMVSARRSFQVESDCGRLEVSVVAGLHRIASELRESKLEYVSLLPDGRGVPEDSVLGVVLPSARSAGTSHFFEVALGQPRWRKWVAYYVAGAAASNGLYRVELPLVSVTSPPAAVQVLNAPGRLLITDHVAQSGLRIAYADALTSDLAQAGGLLYVATPFTASGGLLTFTTSGADFRVVRQWKEISPGVRVEIARPCFQVGLSVVSQGVGSRQAGASPWLQRWNVISQTTEVEVNNP